MQKPAVTGAPIHEILQNRWSPRAFSTRPVEAEKLLSLLEAARWTPSGGNLQPWRFIVTQASDPEPHARLLASLSERNQVWASRAPVLILTAAAREREPGKPNPWAAYDVGQAAAHLSFQAEALGLRVHQMAGFDQAQARAAVQMPESFDPVTILAIGYQDDPHILPEAVYAREIEPRARKALNEIVFDGVWKS